MATDYSEKSPEPYLDLDDYSTGELGDRVQQIRTELETLKQKQEEVERKKLHLEELKRRQDELDVGRSDMLDKLTRSLVVVQREIEEAQKRAEQMQAIYNSFTQHLRQLEAVNIHGNAGGADMSRELSKALSIVEDARTEYVRAQAKLSVAPAGDAQPASSAEGDRIVYEEDRGFGYWAKSGFAFTLPLQLILIFALVVWIWSTMAPAN